MSQLPIHDSSTSLRLVLALAMGSFGLCASACGPTAEKTITVEYTIEQTGLVPAPRGPHGRGPVLDSGKIALEGSYVGNLASESDRARYQGSNGNVVVNHDLSGRLAVGAGGVEIGLDFEYMNANWGTAVPTDVSPTDVDNQNLYRFGAEFRGHFWGDNHRGFGGFFGLSLATLPFYRGVFETRYLTVWEDTEPDWWESQSGKTTRLGSRTSSRQGTEWYPTMRFGLFGTIELIPMLTLQLGLMGQNVPTFFGTTVISESCTTFSDSSSTCEGDDPSDVDPTSTEWLGTAFASLTVSLGMIEFVGQIFGHPLSSNYDYVEASPFGGDIGVRLIF